MAMADAVLMRTSVPEEQVTAHQMPLATTPKGLSPVGVCLDSGAMEKSVKE
jgi:hypothetical protein